MPSGLQSILGSIAWNESLYQKGIFGLVMAKVVGSSGDLIVVESELINVSVWTHFLSRIKGI